MPGVSDDVPRPVFTEADYYGWRDALLETEDRLEVAKALVGAVPDEGRQWIEAAYEELRHTLVQGRLEVAEAIGQLIQTVLQVQEGGADDGFTASRVHAEAIRRLLEGVRDILDAAYQQGMSRLEAVTQAVICEDSLRWAAWLWTTKAAVVSGDAMRAMEAATRTLDLTDHIDVWSRATSYANAAEAEWQVGRHEEALRHVLAASDAFEACEDQRGAALVWLSWARKQAEIERPDEAVKAATSAHAIDPTSEEPVLFLAHEALINENFEGARGLLRQLQMERGESAEAARMARLIELQDSGRVPAAVMREYIRLSERAPSEDTIARLQQLVARNEDFLQLKDLLAWQLTWLGHNAVAVPYFEALASQNVEPRLRTSATLGLACLAKRRHPKRKPGRWLRDDATTLAQPTEAAERSSATSTKLARVDVDSFGLATSEAGTESVLGEAVRSVSDAGQTVSARRARGIGSLGDWTRAASSARVPSTGEASGPPREPPAIPPPPPPEQRRSVAEAAVDSPRAAFAGELQALAVPDLLEFLKTSQRTGTLVLTSKSGVGAVHLRRGLITSAASPNSRGIGQLLLIDGEVNEEQLQEVSQGQLRDQSDRPLGALLVERGYVDEAAVRKALRGQIFSAVLELIAWRTGRFAFESDRHEGRMDSSDIDIELDTQELLLDALRALDELNR